MLPLVSNPAAWDATVGPHLQILQVIVADHRTGLLPCLYCDALQGDLHGVGATGGVLHSEADGVPGCVGADRGHEGGLWHTFRDRWLARVVMPG